MNVTNTQIFARMVSDAPARQALVYSMALEVADDVAMILPIPTAAGTSETAVEFLDFKSYPNFFDDLTATFPASRSISMGSIGAAPAAASLAVQKVGNFDASFVPSVADFHRLDPRFQLPATVWDGTGCESYGFAVFQLRAGKTEVHPMAFSFPTATPTELFFPTLHIHDGTAPPKAHFDHSLFCQFSSPQDQSDHSPYTQISSPQPLGRWQKSEWKANQFVRVDETAGVISPSDFAYRVTVVGERQNQNVTVATSRGRTDSR